ncbi:NADPH-dependent diflavin oxidoreductase 1 isoform X2 [Arctopsyche grandis]|uniref:NADPH-dependent diflavin oxidoreductase 1 isoform X2 n=1 Tax=Arctopsyche grandis TaxID=121162 RepID=UPI00406D8118
MIDQKKTVILYGSQTGNAEELSQLLWRQFKLRGFSGPAIAMDDYDIRNLISEELVIFICSTTGDGEEPDNMKKFWKFLLRKNLPHDSLKKLKFGVLGLGDSSYLKFNFVAKKLNKRLLQLGATQLLDIGLCDYQHDLGNDAIFIPWTAELWKKLSQYGSNPVDTDSTLPSFLPRWNVLKTDFTSDQSIKRTNDLYFPDENNLDCCADKPFIMELKSNIRTTSLEHFQDVRLLEFGPLKETFDGYEPGDVVNLRPRNSKAQVDLFFDIFSDHQLNLHRDDIINVTQIHDDMPVPKYFQKPMLLSQLVEQYWDLSAIPRKYAFSVLAVESENKLEKEKCIEFCSPNGSEDLLNYCNRPRRTILEVLEDFHHSTSKLSLNHLFEMFTSIKPRAFSIASSCKAADRKQIDILVAVVKYFTKLKTERLGLCSNWLKNIPIGMRIFAWVTKGTFVFPKSNTPLIMIGPGTGLAPFRNVILEQEHLQQASNETLILFFGCRNEKGDFHCGDYLKQMESSGKLALTCAFSRDQDNKIYVQHKIEESGSFLWNLIQKKSGCIFIAGNSKNMPDAVKQSFVQIFIKEGNMTEVDASEYLKRLEVSKQLQLETW